MVAAAPAVHACRGGAGGTDGTDCDRGVADAVAPRGLPAESDPFHQLTSSVGWYQTNRIPDCKTASMASPSVTWIFVAPGKGCALVQLDEVELGPDGVLEDRRFHLVGPEGRLLNGKQLAPLVQIVPEWVDESGYLSLRFPSGTEVAGIVEPGERVTTNFYGRREVEGRVVEGPWS